MYIGLVYFVFSDLFDYMLDLQMRCVREGLTQ